MGIKNLNTLLNKHCKDLYKTYKLSLFKGKTIGIDTSFFMFKFKAIVTSDIVKKTQFVYVNGEWSDIDYKRVRSRWLGEFLKLKKAFDKAGVKLSFVFDGIAPEEKANTQLLRKQKHLNTVQKQKQYKNDPDKLEEYKKAIRNNIAPTPLEREALTQLLQLLGCELIYAKGEAEHLCAHLCNTRRFFAVASEDTDLFAYQCRVIFTEINYFNPNYEPTVKAVSSKDVINRLSLTPEQFITTCILSGTDVNDNISGYGPINCYKLVRAHGTFSNIVQNVPDFSVINFTDIFQLFISHPEIQDRDFPDPPLLDSFIDLHLEEPCSSDLKFYLDDPLTFLSKPYRIASTPISLPDFPSSSCSSSCSSQSSSLSLPDFQ